MKYSYHRHPRTLQEMRWNEAHKEYVRGRRNHHGYCGLPSSWDDIPRTIQKTWKVQRKKRKQWMK